MLAAVLCAPRVQGRALNAVAKRDCKMLVVGNPCNTNALVGRAGPRLHRPISSALQMVIALTLNRAVAPPCQIAMENAPDLPRRNWHALTRLDENRAKGLLARKVGKRRLVSTAVVELANAAAACWLESWCS